MSGAVVKVKSESLQSLVSAHTQQNGISQAEFNRRAGIGINASKISRHCNTKTLHRICAVLGVSPTDYILPNTKNQNTPTPKKHDAGQVFNTKRKTTRKCNRCGVDFKTHLHNGKMVCGGCELKLKGRVLCGRTKR